MGKLSCICLCLGLVSFVLCSNTNGSKHSVRNGYYDDEDLHLDSNHSFFYEIPLVDSLSEHIDNTSSMDELFADYFDMEPLVSPVLVDPLHEEDKSYWEMKREAPDRFFYEDTKQKILELHNLYRSNVTPPAGNMAYMEWDQELEHLAQLWADRCVFEHGTPENTEYSRGLYGQNLYLGHDPSAYNALFLWYDEWHHYNIKTQYCKPREQCGHYVQMASGDSDRLGCGIRKCNNRYLIVCHYHQPAWKGQQMYEIGKPCSQCPNEKGSLCKNNLCVTWEQCERMPHVCAEAHCNLHCHNCGKLDPSRCKCTCADGWDSPDCSRVCLDKHKMCGQNPGFRNKDTCSMNKYAVAKEYCRKMCRTCNPFIKDHTFNHVCCDGNLCKEGHVLDLERKLCRCRLLCPGPTCDRGGVLQNSVLCLVITMLPLYFVKYV